jgi:hypothetical protein
MKLHFELHDALYLLNVGPSTIYEDTLPSEARIPLEIKEETFYKFYKKQKSGILPIAICLICFQLSD